MTLSPAALARETYMTLSDNFGRFATALAVPGGLAMLVGALVAVAPVPLLHALGGVAEGFLIAAFAVACHRVILLPGAAAPRLGAEFGRREVRFFIYEILLGLLIGLMTAVLLLPLALLLATAGAALPLVVVAALGVAAMLMGRLGLVLPMAALDDQGRLPELIARSWQLTRGNTVPLFLTSVMVYGPMLLIYMMVVGAFGITGLLEVSVVARIAVGVVGSAALAALLATFLSLAFRALTGWNRGQEASNEG